MTATVASPARRPAQFTLQREAEARRLAAPDRPRSDFSATAPQDGDGTRPTALATSREEHRQILAISRIVCVAAVESLAGLRPVHQMARWLHFDVHQRLRVRAELIARNRHVQHSRGTALRTSPRPAEVRSMRADNVARGVWEVAVIFTDGHRTRACALRLQAHRRRWQVVALELG